MVKIQLVFLFLDGKNANGSKQRYNRKRETSYPKNENFSSQSRRTASQKSKTFNKMPPQRGGNASGGKPFSSSFNGGRRDEVSIYPAWVAFSWRWWLWGDSFARLAHSIIGYGCMYLLWCQKYENLVLLVKTKLKCKPLNWGLWLAMIPWSLVQLIVAEQNCLLVIGCCSSTLWYSLWRWEGGERESSTLLLIGNPYHRWQLSVSTRKCQTRARSSPWNKCLI